MDPFGSSSSNAVLYSLMQFDALVINRVSSDVLADMMKQRTLEFVWEPSSALPPTRASILTHVFDSYFCMPGGAWLALLPAPRPKPPLCPGSFCFLDYCAAPRVVM